MRKKSVIVAALIQTAVCCITAVYGVPWLLGHGMSAGTGTMLLKVSTGLLAVALVSCSYVWLVRFAAGRRCTIQHLLHGTARLWRAFFVCIPAILLLGGICGAAALVMQNLFGGLLEISAIKTAVSMLAGVLTLFFLPVVLHLCISNILETQRLKNPSRMMLRTLKQMYWHIFAAVIFSALVQAAVLLVAELLTSDLPQMIRIVTTILTGTPAILWILSGYIRTSEKISAVPPLPGKETQYRQNEK